MLPPICTAVEKQLLHPPDDPSQPGKASKSKYVITFIRFIMIVPPATEYQIIFYPGHKVIRTLLIQEALESSDYIKMAFSDLYLVGKPNNFKWVLPT